MKDSDPRLVSVDDVLAFSRERDISFEASRRLLVKHRVDGSQGGAHIPRTLESLAHFLEVPS